jgi:hypothetical protein
VASIAIAHVFLATARNAGTTYRFKATQRKEFTGSLDEAKRNSAYENQHDKMFRGIHQNGYRY